MTANPSIGGIGGSLPTDVLSVVVQLSHPNDWFALSKVGDCMKQAVLYALKPTITNDGVFFCEDQKQARECFKRWMTDTTQKTVILSLNCGIIFGCSMNIRDDHHSTKTQSDSSRYSTRILIEHNQRSPTNGIFLNDHRACVKGWAINWDCGTLTAMNPENQKEIEMEHNPFDTEIAIINDDVYLLAKPDGFHLMTMEQPSKSLKHFPYKFNGFSSWSIRKDRDREMPVVLILEKIIDDVVSLITLDFTDLTLSKQTWTIPTKMMSVDRSNNLMHKRVFSNDGRLLYLNGCFYDTICDDDCDRCLMTIPIDEETEEEYPGSSDVRFSSDHRFAAITVGFGFCQRWLICDPWNNRVFDSKLPNQSKFYWINDDLYTADSQVRSATMMGELVFSSSLFASNDEFKVEHRSGSVIDASQLIPRIRYFPGGGIVTYSNRIIQIRWLRED